MSEPVAPVVAQTMDGEVQYDYLKSNFFRVIHVDGVHGGLRPNGTSIHMALFSERNSIPQSETYSVTDGVVGQRTAATGRVAIIREVEIDAVMDLNAARALRRWLDQAIQLAEIAATTVQAHAGSQNA